MVRLRRMTLSSLVLDAAERFGNHKAMSLIGEEGERDITSYAELGRRSRALASALRALGAEKGARVLLIAENSPAWPISYFSCFLAGAVCVPVLTDFLPEHLATIAKHAEVSVVFATAKTLPKLEEAGLAKAIPVLLIDELEEGSIPLLRNGAREVLRLNPAGQCELGSEEDLAVIIYTSGTTGNSKGVMLSHRNILSDAIACRSIIKLYPRDRLLSVLPLAHCYECTIGMIIPVLHGSSIYYLDRPPSPAALLPALKAVRPTIMLTVPLIMEKVYRGKVKAALESHPLYKIRLARGLVTRIAGQKLLATFGGAVRFFGVGGAPLAPEVEAFLAAAKFPYAIGYGLTETAPLIAGAGPYRTVLRSTGLPLKGVEIRIADPDGGVIAGAGAPKGGKPFTDGEIQARGPNVMLGYYKDPQRTAEVFTADGWFRTGDLGCMDERGRVFIRGRLKAMILGPSGENIYPEEIENILNESELVEESLVYHGEKGELVALVVLTEKAKQVLAAAGDMASAAAHGAMNMAEGAYNAAYDTASGAAHRAGEILNSLKAAVNRRVTAFSRIHRVEVQPEPFEKTATQKIKRFLYPRKDKK